MSRGWGYLQQKPVRVLDLAPMLVNVTQEHVLWYVRAGNITLHVLTVTAISLFQSDRVVTFQSYFLFGA